MDKLFEDLQRGDTPLQAKIDEIAFEIQGTSTIVDEKISKLKETIHNEFEQNPPFVSDSVGGKKILPIYRNIVSYSVLLKDNEFLVYWGVKFPQKTNFDSLIGDQEDRIEKLGDLIKALSIEANNSSFPDSGRFAYALLTEKMLEAFETKAFEKSDDGLRNLAISLKTNENVRRAIAMTMTEAIFE